MRRSHMYYPLFLLALLAGCSRSSLDRVSISGKVLFRGKPLPGGIVTFMSPKGFSNTATIDGEGNYQLMAPVGSLKIGVDNRMLQKTPRSSQNRLLKPPPESASLQPISGVYVPIPEKYTSVDTSGLTCSTTSVSIPFNILLE